MVVMFFVPTTTLAVVVNPPTSSLPGAPSIYNNTIPTNDSSLLPGIIAYSIGIAGVLAIIAITWAGIKMFLSVGDENKFNEARNVLIYALVGVGLAGAAYALVSMVSNFKF